MNLDELDQLIRMAQVLKSRCRLLAADLKRTKQDTEAQRAHDAVHDVNNVEARLIQIVDSLTRPSLDT